MRIIVIAIIVLLLGGCATHSPAPGDFVGKCQNPAGLETYPLATDKLLQQYTAWEGAPYRAGGLSRKGIDCSGFVYLTFQRLMGVELPRSADLQANLGRKIPAGDLQAGDLVFFKTGRRGRHVGIYLDNGRFMHASSTKGVTISSLDDRYWARKYWKAIRL